MTNEEEIERQRMGEVFEELEDLLAELAAHHEDKCLGDDAYPEWDPTMGCRPYAPMALEAVLEAEDRRQRRIQAASRILCYTLASMAFAFGVVDLVEGSWISGTAHLAVSALVGVAIFLLETDRA